MIDGIRVIDFILSALGLIILSPILLLVSLFITITSKGPVLYKQVRVGKNGKDFTLLKFRTMVTNADKKGLLTVGGKDNRITVVGYYLRKYKIDELPQLLNVLFGEMSLVGPRPEVRRYVEMYTMDQKKALSVLPGITDYASIVFRNENEILAKASNPEAFYIHEIMPQKLELNNKYIHNRTLSEYFRIIGKTLVVSIRGK